jgi:signal transduction histidine kinase
MSVQLRSPFKKITNWMNRTTQRRLVTWSVGFWLISIVILSGIFLYVAQNQIISEARLRNIQFASTISRDVNTQISNIIGNARTSTQYLSTLGPDLESQAGALLGLRLSSNRYRALYYFDSDSNLLLSLTGTTQNLLAVKNPSELVGGSVAPAGNEIMATYAATEKTRTSISNVYLTPLDYIPVMNIGLPVVFSSGERRIVVFEVDLTDLWQKIDTASIGQTGITYAVSREGKVIAHPEPALIGRQIPDEIRPVLGNYEGSIQFVDPYSHKQVIAAYSPVGGQTGWGIVVQQDRAEIDASIVKTGTTIIVVLLVLGIFGTASILFLIGGFTRPIKELTKTTKNIARTGNLTKTQMEQRSDEVGQLSQAFDQMIDKVKDSQEALKQAQKAKEEAAAAERTRLAHDLHDAVSQTLFSASLIADVLPRLWDKNPDEGRRRLEEIRQLTRGALAEMRTLLFELRPAALVDAELGYLLHQLSQSITGRSRIPVELLVEGECDLQPEIKLALYRITQEALNNVAKHAGASRAEVNVSCKSGEVSLIIRDNGKGFDITTVHPESLGLGIMRERAKGIGAELEINSKIGVGSEVVVKVKNIRAEVQK